MHRIENQIAVMLHFADGGKVQYRNSKGAWEDIPNPYWNWSCWNYRIKPEPKTVWVNEYKDLDGGEDGWAYPSEEAAKKNANAFTAVRIAVEYREVIKDE